MTIDDERRAAWAAVPWRTSLAVLLGDRLDLAARLYAAGVRTAGDLDALVLAYRERDLETVVGLKRHEARLVVGRLLVWSRRRFREAMDRQREDAGGGPKEGRLGAGGRMV